MDVDPTPPQEQMLQYLNLLSNTIGGAHSDWSYSNFPALLLNNSRFMQSQPLPAGMDRGKVKACYYNSQVAVLSQPELTYVEGYAIRDGLLLPLPHAWVMTPEGTAIDPTWENNRGCYLGVAFNTDWLMELLSDRAARGWADENSVFEGNYLEQFSFLQEGLPPAALASMEHVPDDYLRHLDHISGNRLL